MRSAAMQSLDVLEGSWRATLSSAWFLEPAGRTVPGSAVGSWIGEAFLLFRWTMHGDVGPATSEMSLVLGRSDASEAYAALYHDERGTSRVYAMSFDGTRWTLLREDPDMFQRFVADVGPGRVSGRWEASDDRGATWRKDFDLVFDRLAE